MPPLLVCVLYMIITDYGVKDDGKLYTKEIQNCIDTLAAEGGGTLVVPKGTYMCGSIYFKQGVNLHIDEGGVLKGSPDAFDYDVIDTRIEGENCKYYAALINADGMDGFTITGPGTIDGNGEKSWKNFANRRKWNPKCTNKDEQRPRLIFISNCRNVTVENLRCVNAHFWNNHLYKCENVTYNGCHIFSPAHPIKAPSTDAIDIDVCKNVLVKNCYMEVNDDAVVLKGGKGPWADTQPENGSNENIIIEDCEFGFCHGCLTMGSESIHNKNIIMRRIKVGEANNLLWLKMRPDTPQIYEDIVIEDISGSVVNFININPWTQFFDLKDRKDIPLSYARNLTMQNCEISCKYFFFVKPAEDQYRLKDFTFKNLKIKAEKLGYDYNAVEGMQVQDCSIEI